MAFNELFDGFLHYYNRIVVLLLVALNVYSMLALLNAHYNSNVGDQIIYMTTPYFGSKSLTPWVNLTNDSNNPSLLIPAVCHLEYPKCRITFNQSYANQSMAYITHWRDYYEFTQRNQTPLQLPANSKIPNILLNSEPPHLTPRLPESSLFHAVATYRRDSDIYIPYGRVYKQQLRSALKRIDYSLNKTLPVAWMVSRCKTESNREHYVRQLQRHIRVDIYGQCGRFRCPKKPVSGKNNKDCLSKLSKKYYFYLAFENNFDKDYLTEKVYNLGAHSMIPVVYGGANYTALLPPNSFINALDYSPQNLAQLLKTLMNDKKKYNEYFRWKGEYYIQTFEPLERVFCKVCSLIQHSNSGEVFNPTWTAKSGKDIDAWWFDKNQTSWKHH